MITPRFSCTQTTTSVLIRVYIPAVRASDVEIHAEGTLFSLHINPYFLRLVFPGEVVEDDASSATYDPASGYLTVTLTKASPGRDFKDLDILAKLLATPKHEKPPTQPVIEVTESQNVIGVNELQGEEDSAELPIDNLSSDQKAVLQAADNEWYVQQDIPKEFGGPITISTETRYGFLDAYQSYFTNVAYTENEVNELGPDAEKLGRAERRARRIKHEEEKWDEEYYMADFADDDTIQGAISYVFSSEAPCSGDTSKQIAFTEAESMIMLQLPRKEYLATTEQKHNTYLTLISILFSYAYDARTTQYDPTPESVWTIASLTPAFSALDPPPYAQRSISTSAFTAAELHETLLPSVRRSLSFPLYRSFALASTCIKDVSVILRKGKRAVLRALLETKKILDDHEVYYVYSKVWVDDFCVWVAREASDEILRELGERLKTLAINKESIGWDLARLEDAVRRQMERGPDSDDESQPGSGNASEVEPASSSSLSSSSATSSSYESDSSESVARVSR